MPGDCATGADASLRAPQPRTVFSVNVMSRPSTASSAAWMRAGVFGAGESTADDRAARGVLQFDRRHPPGKQCTHQGAFAGDTVIEHAERTPDGHGGAGEIQCQIGTPGRACVRIDAVLSSELT